jgi:hypothetical protein
MEICERWTDLCGFGPGSRIGYQTGEAPETVDEMKRLIEKSSDRTSS